MMNDEKNEGKKMGWLMAVWQKPSHQAIKRCIALLITSSFLFPTISWAFDADNYLYSAIQGIRLGDVGSRGLALDYTIPSYMGKVVEADRQPGDQTYILIQDLHCHYEIQHNITRILDVLTTRYNDINVIAVEGGSGIIPTLELAAIPESAAKRAVSDYFMRQGKITGADSLIINDRPDLELYGAEDERLYSNSLTLIRDFTTEENRGLILELMDQLEFVQEKNYNPELAAFEKRRKLFLKGNSDEERYLQMLIRDASKMGIEVFPGDLKAASQRRVLNYQEKNIQREYLENKLRETAFRTDEERRLFGYQTYMELAEKIINVSASRKDLKFFDKLKRTVAFEEVISKLKENVGEMYVDLPKESKRFEDALQQALKFYELADRRDEALYRNASHRIQDRNEKKIILITGGYHTDAIQEQIKKAGQSYVTIQPRLSDITEQTPYFELLRYPNQPTEFERIIARQTELPTAMAVRNFLTTQNFRTQFSKAVDFVNLAIARMRESDLARLPGLTLERIRGKVIKIASADGFGSMGILFNRNGVQLLNQNDLNQQAGDPTALGSNQVRMVSLAMMGVAILTATILPLLGVTVALTPAMTMLAMSIIIIAGWWMSNNLTGDFWSRVFTKRNIVLASMVLAMFLIPVLSQTMLADTVQMVSGNAVNSFSVVDGLINSVSNVTSALPNTLQVYGHSPALFFQYFTNINQYVAAIAPGTVMAIGAVAGKLTIGTFKGITGFSPSEFSARQIKEQLQRNAKATYGLLLDESDPEPYPGFKTTVSREKVEEIINELVQIGLGFFGQPGKIAWDRSINPGKIQGLLFTAFNKETFLRKENNEQMEIILPQLISVYPLEKSEVILQPLFELIPLIMQKGIAPQAVGELQDGTWSMFGTGDENGEKTKKLVQLVLEHPNNVQKSKDLTDLNSADQEAESLEIQYDLMRHETGHVVALRLSDQLFDMWGSLVDKEMDAVLAGNIPGANQMVGNFFLKEMVKGRNGANRAEEEGRVPAGMSKKELARYKFQIELFCDKWAVFIQEKLGKDKIALARNGLQLTAEQRSFFEKYLQKVLVEYGDGLMNFSAKATQTRIYKITGILAAANETEPSDPLAAFYAKFGSMLQGLAGSGDRALSNGDEMIMPEENVVLVGALETEPQVAETETETILAAEDPFANAVDLVSTVEIESGVVPARTVDMQVDGANIYLKDAAASEEMAVATADNVVAELESEADPFAISDDLIGDQNQPTMRRNTMQGELIASVNQTDSVASSMEGGVVNSESNIAISSNAGQSMVRSADFASSVTSPAVNPQVSRETQSVFSGQNPTGMGMNVFSGNLGNMANRGSFNIDEAQPTTANQGDPFAMQLGMTGRGAETANVGNNGVGEWLPYALANQLGSDTIIGADQAGTGANKSALPWTPIPAQDLPGSDKGRNTNKPIGDVGRANPDMINALVLPKGVQNTLLGDPRLTYLLGQAERIIPTLPENQPITFGFDSKDLAGRMQEVLTGMAGSDKGAALASRIHIQIFPQDPNTGLRLTPSNWKAQNGITVLSDQMSNLHTATVVLNADGNAAVAVPMYGIAKDKVNPESLQSIPGWEKILAAHDAALKLMRNQADLNGYYLVTAATLNELQQAQSGLLSNLLTPVTGFQDVSQLSVNIPMSALQTAARPAFDQGEQRVVIDVNLDGLAALQRASSADTLGTITFGTSEIVSSSSSNNLNSAFIQALLSVDAIEAMPVGMAVEENALEREFGIDSKNLFNQLLQNMKSGMEQLLGKQAASKITQEKLEQQADALRGLDNATFAVRDKKLGDHLTRLRGRAWEQPPSLFFSDIYYSFKHGRMPARPLMNIGNWKPMIEESKHAQSTKLAGFASALLLGFAAGVLIFETLVRVMETRDAKGKRLSVFKVMVHPEFRAAARMMFMVVMGNKKAMDSLPEPIRQQVAELNQLVDLKDNAEEAAAFIGELTSDQLSDVFADGRESQLKYSLTSFQRFLKLLLNHTIFKFIMRWIARVENILPIYSKLFILLSESKSMQFVVSQFAPAEGFRQQAADLDGLHPALRENLQRSVATANEELNQLTEKLTQLQQAGTPDALAIQAVQSQISDRRFTLLLNRALDNLGGNINNRNIRRVIRVLMKELARDDLANAEEYQENILKLMTLIEPFQQVSVQIVLGSGKVVQSSIPASLNDTVLRDQLLFFLDVYDSEGKQLQPLRRKILRAGASA